MKGMKRVAKGTGKVTLALLTGLLIPILIWVALGVALNQRLREGKTRRVPATAGGFETGAGLAAHEEAPKHCWEVLHCPPDKREICPAYARRDLPDWVATGLVKGGKISEACISDILIDLKGQPSRV